jgi:hypothetical protein
MILLFKEKLPYTRGYELVCELVVLLVSSTASWVHGGNYSLYTILIDMVTPKPKLAGDGGEFRVD